MEKQKINIFSSKLRKDNSGVTLIALVVTVIVLIILAGVSITSLTGEKGIIKEANKAKKDTELAEKQHQDNLNEIDNEMKNDGDSSGGNDLPTVPDNNIIQNGSVENPYQINSINDLVAVMEYTRKNKVPKPLENINFVITKDLDFMQVDSYSDPYTKIFGDLNGNKTTTSLIDELNDKNFNGLKNAYTFAGNLDGQGHTIKNFWMADFLDGGDTSIALISDLYGVIKNLNVEGNMKVSVRNRGPYFHIGTFAARNYGEIRNCKSYVNINLTGIESPYDGSPYLHYIRLGGICGRNEKLVDGCINYGNISADIKFRVDVLPSGGAYDYVHVGGIVGNNERLLTNVMNYGEVRVKKLSEPFYANEYKPHVAGIAGKASRESVIENALNFGSVYGESLTVAARAAGIVADIDNIKTTELKNVYNAGYIYGSAKSTLDVAGIVADGYGNIVNAYNTGKLSYGNTSRLHLGGIIGDVHSGLANSSFVNCKYNKVDGIFGAQESDPEYVTPVVGLTKSMVIAEMNQNVDINNASSTKTWYKLVETSKGADFIRK